MESTVFAEQRYKDGLECARRATQYDQEGHLSAALSFYSEAVEALNQACSLNPTFGPILPRVSEYAQRAEEIRVQYRRTGGNDIISRSFHRMTRILVCKQVKWGQWRPLLTKTR